MKLICCGSGSSGNTYLLTDGKETLVLDCGMPFKDAKIALGFKVRGIQAALVTHKHLDHAKYIHEYEAAGIPVIKSYEAPNLREHFQLGGFQVFSFPVVHNVPCVGYMVKHKDFGKLLYVTDAEYLRYRFDGLNVMLIEANYSTEYANKLEAKYRHVLTGHMSIETCVDAIRANASEKLSHVVLVHLSDGNSNEAAFREAVEAIVPAGCTVDVASKGLTVDLNDVPF